MVSQLRQIWSGFLNKLKKFFEFIVFRILPQRKLSRIASLAFMLTGIFIVGSYVFAVPSDGLLSTVLDLFNVILLVVVEMLGWVLMKIFAIVIVISSYNEFVTNPAVIKGWVLVRDICNLFFVLILLLIAFAQIFQVEKYSLKALLPKLLVGAILVNFSKLIAGLIIDFGQVVMMTFVNGYAATAGANLVNGLGLAKLLSLKDTGDVGAPDSTDVFIALFVAIFILIMSIVIVFFILLLLLLRIVYLWILVVLSPIAFVFPAVPIAGLQGKASEWWKKFGWSVAVGPLMAFFLWMSLMVMSNPDEIIAKNYAQVEAKSTSSVVSGISSISTLMQSALGLAMLFGGLMVAQEAGGAMGGAMGSLANTAMKSAKSAATSVGKKMTGYGFVADRVGATYAGFAAKQKEKKAAALAVYSGYGEKAFAKKEAGIRAAKRVGATGLRAGAAVAVGAGALVARGARKIEGSAPVTAAKAYLAADYAKTKSHAGGIMNNIGDIMPESLKNAAAAVAEKGRAAGAAIGDVASKVGGVAVAGGALMAKGGKVVGGAIKGQWDQTAHVGGMNLVAEDRIKQDEYKNAMAGGETVLKARGISTPEELKKAMTSNDEDEGVRKASALKLASMGKMDAKTAAIARGLMKGDRVSDGALEESLLKKQAHLAFDLTDPKKADRLQNMMREGAVDISGQNADTYEDTEFMNMAKDALGDKVFSQKMQDVSKKSSKHKDAVGNALTKMMIDRAKAEAPNRVSAEATLARADSTDDEKNQAKQILKDLQKGGEDFRKALANVTGNLNEAYGQRDADGQLKKTGETVDFDASLVDEFENFVKGLSSKQLAGMDMKANSVSELAKNISPQQISGMALIGDSGAMDRIETIVKEIIRQGDTDTISRVAANQNIKDALPKDILKELNDMVESVKTAAKNKADSEVAAARATEEAAASARAVAEAAAKEAAEREAGMSKLAAGVSKDIKNL
jgi:hypothetical protein